MGSCTTAVPGFRPEQHQVLPYVGTFTLVADGGIRAFALGSCCLLCQLPLLCVSSGGNAHRRRADWSDLAMDGWSTPSHLVVHISEVHRQVSIASLWAIVSSMEGVAATRRYCAFLVGTIICQTEAPLVRCQ